MGLPFLQGSGTVSASTPPSWYLLGLSAATTATTAAEARTASNVVCMMQLLLHYCPLDGFAIHIFIKQIHRGLSINIYDFCL